MSEPVNYSSGQWVCGSVTQLTFHILINQSLIHLFSYITKGSLIDPGGGDSHMKQTGMLVGNFEFNP